MAGQPCTLNTCFLCTHCLPDWKEAVAVHKKTYSYKKGDSIFKEGDKVNGIYFMYAGSAKVHKQWSDEKELIIRFAKTGDILGHRGLAANELYPVSATSLEDSKACFISNSFLEATLRTNHSLTYTLMQFYAAELQKAEMRMRNLALMDVKARIAETLLELLGAFGRGSDNYITVPVTRQDIAAYSGTTYETVFKFLKTLTISKSISVSGKSIRINDENKLRKIVKMAK